MEDQRPSESERSLREPEVRYNALRGKKVRIFRSFKEQEDEMIDYWASITPLQRLAHLYEMVKMSFGITEDEARKRQRHRKVTIIRYEP